MVYKDKQKAKEYQKEYHQKPEVKAKKREYFKEYNQRPEVIARRKELYQRPEFKKERKEYLQRQDVKAKAKEYRQRPEIKEYHKEYSQKHQKEYYQRLEVKARKKEYEQKLEVKKKKKKYIKKYVKNHREQINKRLKKKCKVNKNFNIRMRLGNLLRYALNRYTKIGKYQISRKYGINYKAIIKHLKPFPEDLSKYHIDHIKPLCSFNLENPEEIKKAFAPENHQWLTIQENLSKGGRY